MAIIKHKKSGVAGKKPALADLSAGEALHNYVDGVLYMKKISGGVETIVEYHGSETPHVLKQVDTPANPSAGYLKIYGKSDANIYIKNSDGVESKLFHSGMFNPTDYLPLSGGTLTGPLIINKSVGGDGGWDDAGIIIKNNNGVAGEAALSFQNASVGNNYWIQGLNQSEDYKIAFGTSFSDASTKLVLDMYGNLWNGNKAYRYWHAGNDGGGSGLDADTLDGIEGSNLEYKQTLNTVRTHAGTSYTREIGFIHGTLSNQLRFISPEFQEESIDGINWGVSNRLSAVALSTLMIGDGNPVDNTILPNTGVGTSSYYRLTWDATQTSQANFNFLYLFTYTQGNSVTITVEIFNTKNNNWTTLASGPVNNWPGHVTIPHSPFQLHPTVISDTHYKKARITFSTTFANTYPCVLSGIEWFGNYPSKSRNIFYIDRLKNATFPSAVRATELHSLVANGTPPLQVYSNTRVPNLNADLLDGNHASAFLPVAGGAMTSSTLVTNLNAHYLNGIQSSGFMRVGLELTSDLNSIVTSGTYRIQINSNRPSGTDYGNMLVLRGQDTIAQLIMGYNSSDKIYWRNGSPVEVGGGEQWREWKEIWHSANFNPANYLSNMYLSTRQLADANTISAGVNGSHLISTASNRPFNTSDYSLLTLAYDTNFGTQLAGDWNNNELCYRARNGAGWMPWVKIWHSGNFNSANFLSTAGGQMANNNLVTNLNAEFLGGKRASEFDNYVSWNLLINNDEALPVTKDLNLKFVNGSNMAITRVGNVITFNASGGGATYSVFSRSIAGLVPAPGGTTTTRYLREDGTWVTPPTGSASYTFQSGNGVIVSPDGTGNFTFSADFTAASGANGVSNKVARADHGHNFATGGMYYPLAVNNDGQMVKDTAARRMHVGSTAPLDASMVWVKTPF